MKSPRSVLAALVFLSGPSFAATYDWSAEPMKKVQINTVAFRGWTPDSTEPLSGTLVLIPGRHGDGRGMAGDPRWQQLAAELGFAIVACQFADGDRGMYQGDVSGEVAKTIDDAVAHLADTAGKPELKKAPLAFWGHSAGSNVSSRYCKVFPGRVAAFGSSKGTWGPGDSDTKTQEIPMVFAIGATDNPEWVKTATDNVAKGAGKAPWTVAIHKTEGHGLDKSLDLIIPFLSAAVKQRLGKSSPSAGGAGGTNTSIFKSELPKIGQSSASTASPSASLKKINPRDGWLGDPDTCEVAPSSAFKGSKTKAVWLPDETVALAWQTYVRGQ